jgi:hypothetical protein
MAYKRPSKTMKRINKTKIMMLLFSLFIVACSSNNDDNTNTSKVVINPHSMSMFCNDTKTLVAPEATKWEAENDFVAKVNSKGDVTGMHVGETQIKASNGFSSDICNVRVIPKYTLCDTPIFEWNESLKTIKGKDTHKLVSENDQLLLYNYDFGSTNCAVSYVFKNNKLSNVYIVLDFAKFANAVDYLNERYNQLSYDSKQMKAIYIDGYTKATHTMGVIIEPVNVDNTKCTSILYTPYGEK